MSLVLGLKSCKFIQKKWLSEVLTGLEATRCANKIIGLSPSVWQVCFTELKCKFLSIMWVRAWCEHRELKWVFDVIMGEHFERGVMFIFAMNNEPGCQHRALIIIPFKYFRVNRFFLVCHPLYISSRWYFSCPANCLLTSVAMILSPRAKHLRIWCLSAKSLSALQKQEFDRAKWDSNTMRICQFLVNLTRNRPDQSW